MSLAFATASDYTEMSRRAADFVSNFIRSCPSAVIALPTGETPKLMYDLLARSLLAGETDCSNLMLVNLDEYVGLSANHPCSFASTLRRLFLRGLPIAPERVRLLNGDAADLEAECDAHEGWIHGNGGVDLAILGIGVNGHIGFNEPGTNFDTRTHVVHLAESTVARRQDGCQSSSMLALGITMGIRTILDASEVLLLASGCAKAEALRCAFFEDASAALPASALQTHPRVTVVADMAALSRLPKEFWSATHL